MTRAEAIKYFEKSIAGDTNLLVSVAHNPDAVSRVKESLEANKMALAALRMLEEREQQPLTMAELRKLHGETVYCLELNTDVKITAPKAGFINISYGIPGESGTFRANGMTLYRCRPEEERE